ncbi:MAG: SLC13 family permease [Pirellulales bacterium]
MNQELVLVLGLLGAAIAMFAINKPRMDAVALIMLCAAADRCLDDERALAGFSDPNIVLIAALFVLGDGLVRTGVARRLGDWLAAKAGSSESRLVALLMSVVCGLGATMSSTAVTAIFIPVAQRISRTLSISPARLMMPISMAALISGMTTLIATAPNLVVNSELVRSGRQGFHFFSFTPFGVPILALGIAYMYFARHWLADNSDASGDGRPSRPKLADWLREYQLADREHRVKIRPGSPLAGKTLADARLHDASGANLVAIERDGKLIQPHANTELVAGDILFVDFFAAAHDIDDLRDKYLLDALPMTGSYFTDRAQEIGMAEAIVPATSGFVGKTVAETDLRTRYRLTVVGLRRGQNSFAGALRDEPLHVGDTLLMIGPWHAIRGLGAEPSELVVYNLPAELEEVLPVSGKAIQAVFCLALAVGMMVSGVLPNVQAALIGCLAMGLLGCVDLNSAYRAIDWKTLVLIVGMLPFSIALKRTGGVDMAADGLMGLVGDAGPRAILATLFVITSVLGMFISNTATAVLMAPIAISVAKELEFSPYPFAMIVALASSAAFMTPVSSPVNTLVVTPGNYSFGDFLRVGVPFTLLVLVVSTIMVPWLLPL